MRNIGLRLRITAPYAQNVVSVLCVLALSACAGDNDAQWVNADRASEFLADSASRAALRTETVEALPLSCDDLLADARRALSKAGSPELRVLIQACSDTGQGFGAKLRCKNDVLQVRCS